jgi:hypothetical protein
MFLLPMPGEAVFDLPWPIAHDFMAEHLPGDHFHESSPSHLFLSPVPGEAVFDLPWPIAHDFMAEHLLSHLFSKENQVQTYMHARIKFHAYS